MHGPAARILAVLNCELRVVLVLAGTGKHVEVNAADLTLPLPDFVHFDIAVPRRRATFALVAHTKKFRREVEYPSAHSLVLEVGPHLLRTVVVLFGHDLLLIKG